MQSITVKRYPDPVVLGWAGFLEPADKSWIGFIDLQGRPTFFLNRDPTSGSVLPDDPALRDAAMLTLAYEQKRREAYDTPAPPITYATAIDVSGQYVGKTASDATAIPPEPLQSRFADRNVGERVGSVETNDAETLPPYRAT